MFEECQNNLTEWLKTMFVLSSSSFIMSFVNRFDKSESESGKIYTRYSLHVDLL